MPNPMRNGFPNQKFINPNKAENWGEAVFFARAHIYKTKINYNYDDNKK